MCSNQNGLNVNDNLGKVSVVLGTQWGDEGKEKSCVSVSGESDMMLIC